MPYNDFKFDLLPFPTIPKFPVDLQPDPEETSLFEPEKHISFVPPKAVFDMTMKKMGFPYTDTDTQQHRHFAITPAFKILSEEGVKTLREIINKHANDPRIHLSSNRAPHYLRGLGCISPFVFSLGQSEILTRIASEFAGEALAPHTYLYNLGHSNLGRTCKKDENGVAKIEEVDALHADSVDFVLVIMLSDPNRFVGGSLEACIIQPLSQAMESVNNNGLRKEDVIRINFTEPGQAMFMRGSQFLHRVKPVLESEETPARVTCIFSFMSRNISVPDSTHFGVFRPDPFSNMEFARHKVWRIRGLLERLNQVPFETPLADIISFLQEADDELRKTIRILKLEESDEIPFFDAKTGKFCTVSRDFRKEQKP